MACRPRSKTLSSTWAARHRMRIPLNSALEADRTTKKAGTSLTPRRAPPNKLLKRSAAPHASITALLSSATCCLSVS
jgi:hypothetical protein